MMSSVWIVLVAAAVAPFLLWFALALWIRFTAARKRRS